MKSAPFGLILAYLQTSMGASRFVSTMEASSGSGVRLSRVVCEIPAQLTRISTGPTASPLLGWSTQSATAKPTHVSHGAIYLGASGATSAKDALDGGRVRDVQAEEAVRGRHVRWRGSVIRGRGWGRRRRRVRGQLGFELGASLEGGAAEEGDDGAVGGEGLGYLGADDAGRAYDGAVLAGEAQGRHCAGGGPDDGGRAAKGELVVRD